MLCAPANQLVISVMSGVTLADIQKVSIHNGFLLLPGNVRVPSFIEFSATFGSTFESFCAQGLSAKITNVGAVVRAMPNTPALVAGGCAVFCMNDQAGREDADATLRIFHSVGLCEQVPESQMNAFTGLSGSGPAYVSLDSTSLVAERELIGDFWWTDESGVPGHRGAVGRRRQDGPAAASGRSVRRPDRPRFVSRALL